DDPNPDNWFNVGGGLRQSCDRLWGTLTSNLPSSEGLPVYVELNDATMIGASPSRSLPPIYAFNGKNDIVVGWAEKIPFYQAIRDARESGSFFWDGRDHWGSATAAWAPLQDPQVLHRFRTNRSFPALTHCSADDDPGDGNA